MRILMSTILAPGETPALAWPPTAKTLTLESEYETPEEFGVERETRLELATSSLEVMRCDLYSTSSPNQFGALDSSNRLRPVSSASLRGGSDRLLLHEATAIDASGDITLACHGVLLTPMTVELTQDDWNRLTRLVHSHGSVRDLEQALTRTAPVEHRGRPSVDLADMVRVEVAHQLGASRVARRPLLAARGVIGRTTQMAALRAMPTSAVSATSFWAIGALLVAIVVGTIGGLSPIRAAVLASLALGGLSVSLHDRRGLHSMLWRAAIALCAVAWTVAASWPVELRAMTIGSALAACIVEPMLALSSRTTSE
jgi:hypothetical protein